jgi:RNA polymerase sigma factor (sigma-70 family)
LHNKRLLSSSVHHPLQVVNVIPPNRAEWLARHICPHEPALRRWLTRRPSFRYDIDDIVQEAYAKLALLPSIEHITNPRAYFFRTAFSVLVNETRRAQVVSIDSLGELDRLDAESQEVPPDIQAESRQELRQVAEAIAQLPLKCREAFILRKVHGLSQRECAVHLGISESTVEKHVGRGIRHLVGIFGRGGKAGAPASIVRRPDAGTYAEARNE